MKSIPAFVSSLTSKPSNVQTTNHESNNHTNYIINKYEEEKKIDQENMIVYQNLDELKNSQIGDDSFDLNCVFVDNATEVDRLNASNFKNNYSSRINRSDLSVKSRNSSLGNLEKSISEIEKHLDDIIKEEILKNEREEPKNMFGGIELLMQDTIDHTAYANFDLVNDVSENYSWDASNFGNRFSDEIKDNKLLKDAHSSPLEDLEKSIIEIERNLDEIIKNTLNNEIILI